MVMILDDVTTPRQVLTDLTFAVKFLSLISHTYLNPFSFSIPSNESLQSTALNTGIEVLLPRHTHSRCGSKRYKQLLPFFARRDGSRLRNDCFLACQT